MSGTPFDKRETATILAALRFWQAAGDQRIDCPQEEIATNCDEFAPLHDDEIDDLCMMINTL